MRVIDADKIDFGEVFIGASDFAKDTRNTAQMLIDSQPTVNQWILCSERLPTKEEYLKDNGRFIVTDGNRVYQSLYDIYETERFVFITGGNTNFKREVDKCVIKWQPLPNA